MSELLLSPQFFWDCLWQSTLILALGILGSGVWSRRAARAHRILVLSILAALLTPPLTQIARQQGWGVLPPVEITVDAAPTPQNAPANETGSVSGNLSTSTSTENPSTPQPKPVLSAPEPPSALAPVSSPPDPFWTVPPWTVLAAILWGLASFAIGARFSVCLLRESHFLRHAVSGMNPEVEGAVKQAVYALQLNAFPHVYFSRQLHSPVIWCWGRRPVLYLPFSLKSAGPAEGLAGVICHELAHWKRKDHWAEGLAVLGLCLMPWQPLLWWMRHRLGALSELACDEWVLACGHSGETYSEYLYQLLSQRKTALALPAIGYRNNLKQRIFRILHSASTHPQSGWVWDCAVFVLMGLLIGGLALFHAPLVLSYPKVSPQSEVSKISTARQFQVPEGFRVSRLSPDGKHIACVSDSNELLVFNLETRVFDKIAPTSNWYILWFALWSADGKRLAYIKDKYEPTPDGKDARWLCSLVVTDIETKQTEVLLDMGEQFLQLEDWSRDGKYIVATENPYFARHENHVLALISLESKEITYFDTTDQEPTHVWGQFLGMHPRFSPQGDFISYRVNNPTNEESQRYFLHIQSLDGKQHFQTEDPFNFRYPLWSPDGEHILFEGFYGRDVSLYAVKVDEGKVVGPPFVVIPKFGLGLPLTMTPDGQFAYSTLEHEIDNNAVYIAEIDPATKKGRLSAMPAFEGISTHAWSPDGKTLMQANDAFLPYRELSLTGDELQLLKVEGISSVSRVLCWSKDGSFLVGRDSNRGIYKMDRRTGNAQVLLPLSPDNMVQYMDLAPNDQTLVFTQNNIIYRAALDTGQQEELVKRDAQKQILRCPVFSPDQIQIAYIECDLTDESNSIHILSLQDGTTREFAKFAMKEQPTYYLDWSPDGECLAYVTDRIWMAPLDGTPAYSLEQPANIYFDASALVQWAPDGKHISCHARHKNKGKYWILDNFEVPSEVPSPNQTVESAPLSLPRLKPASVELVRFTDSKADGRYASASSSVSQYVRDSQSAYQLIETGLREGGMPYTDRTYKYVSIPMEMRGLTYLQTPEGDRGIWDTGYEVVLNLKEPTYVLVGVESRTVEYWKKVGKPSWIRDYAPMDYKIFMDNPVQNSLRTFHQIFVKKAEAGELVLGDNRAMSNTDMYIAFFGEE